MFSVKIVIAILISLFVTSLSLAAEKAPILYEGASLTEDVTWRGSILVKGFVVVAPHATLRIEPGTIVRFEASTDQQLPNLVVQGRIHAVGTADKPIIFTPDKAVASSGAWGGLVLIATEKRNALEHCRIEYADTGIDVRFSTVNLKGTSIVKTRLGLIAYDGIVQLNGVLISGAETGVEAHNSELDVRDSTIELCQRGCAIKNSTAVFASSKIINNRNSGLESDECRLKVSGVEFTGNLTGARIRGGDGQIVSSGFIKNQQTALHLSQSRIKIHRCRFSDNSLDAVRVDDGWALLVNNVFSSNGGKNIYNGGSEAVSARQNWWESTNAAAIREKNYDALQDSSKGVVYTFPWLQEKPPLMP